MTTRQFPPRVFPLTEMLKTDELFCGAFFHKAGDGRAQTEYISLSEHDSILREERAKIYKEVADNIILRLGEWHPVWIEDIINDFLRKAKADRGK